MVEKAKFSTARDNMIWRLRSKRVSMELEKAGADELVNLLNMAGGKHIVFMQWGGESSAEETDLFDLKLANARLLDVLGIITKASELRFVYGDGIIWLKHKSLVVEETYLKVYDIRLAVTKMRSFPGPRMGLRSSSDEDEPEEEDTTQTFSGLDQELIEQLIRRHVLPDTWDVEKGPSLSVANGLLIIRQSYRGHREVRKLLRILGV